MKFIVRLANDWEYGEEIILNSMEDLKGLSARYQRRLVVDFYPLYGDIPEIIVYNDYLE